MYLSLNHIKMAHKSLFFGFLKPQNSSFTKLMKDYMPFIRTNLPIDTSPEKQRDIVQGIHDALVESIGMPQDELFNMVSHYVPGQFACSPNFNGVERSDRVVVIEITMRRGRSDAMKRNLYTSIARNLEANAGVKPSDIFIFMHENDYSDWSVGHGVFAMALVQQAAPIA